MKKIFVLLAFTPVFSFAQIDLDSLWSVWNDPTQADTNRVDAIGKIAWNGYLFTNPDSAYYYAQVELDMATEMGDTFFMAHALNTQGATFFIRSMYDPALEHYQRGLQYYEAINHVRGIAGQLNNLGLICKEQGNYSQSIEHFTRALGILESEDDQHGVARVLGNIGSIYRDQEDLDKAIEYFNRTMTIQQEIGDQRGIASTLGNLGLILTDQGKYDESAANHRQAMEIRKEIGDINGVANSYGNLGMIDFKLEKYTSALDHYNQCLAIREELGDQNGIAGALISLGRIYEAQGQHGKARDFCARGLRIAEEAGAALEIQDAALALWQINKSLGQHKAALDMYELYNLSKDSLESDENKKAIIRQEYKYQYEKKAATDSVRAAERDKVQKAELAAKNAENERNLDKIKFQNQRSYFLYGGLALAVIAAIIIFNRLQVTRRQRDIIDQQKKVVEKQKEEVVTAHLQLEEKNKEILDSINYAQRIQAAILPPLKLVREYLNESFIYYQPKDVVAGDFYWMEPTETGIYFAAADCTGHGVPGAMVSVICNGGLNRSVREFGLTDPGQILDKTRELVIQEFQKSEDEVKDGMDIALCKLEGSKLSYAGANNPLWIVRDGEILETKADKQPIGKYADEKPFTTHVIELRPNDAVYVFSDGFPDQFGGEKGKKYKSGKFKKFLISVQGKTIEEQRALLEQEFESWKGDLEQIDDVCVIGVRV